MSFWIKYDDVALTDYMRIIDVQRNIGTGHNNVIKQIGKNQMFQTSYQEPKKIKIEFRIFENNNSLAELRLLIAGLLNKEEPKKLVFGDEPNKYYLALIDGQVDLKEATLFGTGTMTFVVPDGMLISTSTKEVHAEMVNGVLTATVQNNGTAVTYPTYKIKQPSGENGYIGIVHAGGALEVGNKEEVDIEEYTQATTILNTTNFSEFTRYTGVNPENSQKGHTGTAAIVNEGGTNYFHLSNAGTNNGYWHGASYVYDFPADGTGHIGAKNVYCYFNAVFWAGLMGQTAQFQVLFADKNNKVVMGYDIYKNDARGNTGVWVALAGDGSGGIKSLATHTFATSHLDSDNPFNKPRGHCDIYKNGAELRYYWFGSYPKFTVPALKNVEITKCYINLYQFGARSGNQLMRYFDFRKMTIRNDSAEYLRDVRNRYQSGSEITIDTESANVYVNGLPANNELVNGSVFAPLHSGENKIEFYNSSWTDNPPEITVEYKERWL
ncbi:phage tail family protein [Pseudolactococcus yaeyamensis]